MYVYVCRNTRDTVIDAAGNGIINIVTILRIKYIILIVFYCITLRITNFDIKTYE